MTYSVATRRVSRRGLPQPDPWLLALFADKFHAGGLEKLSRPLGGEFFGRYALNFVGVDALGWYRLPRCESPSCSTQLVARFEWLNRRNYAGGHFGSAWGAKGSFDAMPDIQVSRQGAPLIREAHRHWLRAQPREPGQTGGPIRVLVEGEGHEIPEAIGTYSEFPPVKFIGVEEGFVEYLRKNDLAFDVILKACGGS